MPRYGRTILERGTQIDRPVFGQSPLSGFVAALAALDPYSWWPMQETSGTTFVDRESNINMSLTGSITLNQTGPSFPGLKCQCVTVGSSGIAKTALLPHLPTFGTNNWSFVLWMKGSFASNAVDFYTSTFNDGFTPGGGSTTTIFTGGGSQTTSPTISDTLWHLIAVTWANKAWTWYVDGSARSNGTAAASPSNETAAWRFDQAIGSGQGCHLAVFPGVTLTATQIAGLYTAAVEPQPIPPQTHLFAVMRSNRY